MFFFVGTALFSVVAFLLQLALGDALLNIICAKCSDDSVKHFDFIVFIIVIYFVV